MDIYHKFWQCCNNANKNTGSSGRSRGWSNDFSNDDWYRGKGIIVATWHNDRQ